MQATSLAALPVQTGTDGAAESTGTGQGIRISSSQHTKTRDSLFTTILQKGITLRAPGSGTDEAGNAPAPDDGTKSGEETIDVCSLLMQLTMLGAVPLTAGGSGGAEETAGTAEGSGIPGLPGVIAANPELADPAVTGDMNLTGKLGGPFVNPQSSIGDTMTAPTQTAASGVSGLPGGSVPSEAVVTGTGQADTVLSGIVSALQGELVQNTAAQGASDTTPQSAAAAPQAQVSQMASAAAGAVGNAVTEDIPGGVAQANIHAAQNGSPATDTAHAEKTSASDTSGRPVHVSNAGQAITAAVLKDPEGASAGGRESDTGQGMSPERSEYADGAGSPMAGISGGRFSGVLMAEKTAAEAAAETAAAAEKALNRLGEDIRSLRGGAHELRIVLEPESLGTLIISVVKTENGVSAKIKSEDKNVVAAISDQLQKLITGMENKGIHLEDVDVVYSQTGQDRGFGQNGFTQGGGGSPRGYAASAGHAQSSDAPEEDLFTGYYSEAPGGGYTVDYTV